MKQRAQMSEYVLILFRETQNYHEKTFFTHQIFKDKNVRETTVPIYC